MTMAGLAAPTPIPRARQSARSVLSGTSSTADKPPSKPVSKPVSLPKRLLFPHLPADADLPPLLASPTAAPALNAELYDFIALALRAHVNPWWTKITRYDREFLPAITRVLTSVILSLEARIVATDLAPLFLRDLPVLLTQHYVDFRSAKSKLHTSYASGGAASLPQLFHHLQPHMAITADGRIDDVYVRQAVDHILKKCLPSEDYEPEAERYIVREITLSVLLRNVLPRITQPWFIHKLILDNLGPEQKSVTSVESTGSQPTPNSDNSHTSRAGFSLQSLAIHFLSAIQSISGACLVLLHAYKQMRDTIKKVNESQPRFPQQPLNTPPIETPEEGKDAHPLPNPVSVPGTLPTPVTPQLDEGGSSTPLDQRPLTPTSISSVNPMHRTTSKSTIQTTSSAFTLPPPPPPPPIPPNYTHPSLTLLLTLLTPPPSAPGSSRTTSACTALAIAQTLFLPLTFLEPFISRLLPYLLYTHIFSADRLADIVHAARRALFPEGWPGHAPPDPTPEEQVAMRAELGRRLLTDIPAHLIVFLGPTPEARAHTIDGILDPLSLQACNAHLMLFILDLVLLTVFPELGVSESAAEGSTST